MTNFSYRKFFMITLTALTLIAGFAVTGHAQWHSQPATIVAVPGLSIVLNDQDFNDRWNHSGYNDRARFCHDVRHDCDLEGRYSRACHLKWKYCSPQHKDYGYYYNR